jgi:hypothetical protein
MTKKLNTTDTNIEETEMPQGARVIMRIMQVTLLSAAALAIAYGAWVTVLGFQIINSLI